MKNILLLVIHCSLCVALFADSDLPVGFALFKRLEPDRREEKMSQSFMFTRPVFQNITANQAAYWHDAVYDKIGCLQSSFQVIPLIQDSFESAPQARYFLINHKNTLVVKGDDVTNDLSMTASVRDVRAEWLQLPGDFLGTFSISPKQKQFGLWGEINQDLCTFVCHDYLAYTWLGAAFAFQVVENDLQPEQLLFSQKPATVPMGIVEAFNRSNLCYARIANFKRTHKSVSEIRLKIGTTLLQRDGFQIGVYSSLIIPTFGHQDPLYTFDPFLGHNRHWGFGTGLNFQLPLNTDVECKLVALYFSIENLYFLRNLQNRTLDLRFKPWSRYLLLNRKNGEQNIPAANVLSPLCKVIPFNFVDFSCGIRVQASFVELEVGYALWAHPDEEIKLHKPFPEEWGIAAAPGILIPGTNIGATASESTIAEQAAPDRDNQGNLTFVTIKERDLDLRSGAARAAVAHRAHLSIGFVIDRCTFAFFGGIGGYVQIPQQNTSMKAWGAWGKFGGTF